MEFNFLKVMKQVLPGYGKESRLLFEPNSELLLSSARIWPAEVIDTGRSEKVRYGSGSYCAAFLPLL